MNTERATSLCCSSKRERANELLASACSRWLVHSSVIALLLSLAFQGTAAVDFNRQIRPILADNCFECHGPDMAARKADLRLDTREGIMGERDGHSVLDLIRERVTSKDPKKRMPPVGAHRRPSSEQLKVLDDWMIFSGEYQDHWAFVAPRQQRPPDVEQPGWCRTGVDRFVMSKLQRLEWSPQPEASREILIRRLSLDIRGLPPTPDEVARFVKDRSPGAYEMLVDRLLESPRYGEHMAWGWMQAARYADTDGFQSDAERHMWRWRDWVIDAFNRNLPYDQFTIEQLAGDLLPNPTPDQILATGFNRNHRYDKGSGTIQAESIFENATDRLETTATVWLGLTVGCARCHDHKFDPISSREYYEMLAFFDKVPENGQAILFNSHPRMKTPTLEQQERLAELGFKIAAAERNLEALQDQAKAAQREWEKGATRESVQGELLSRGLVDVFHLDRPEAKGKVKNGPVKFVKGIKGKAMEFGTGAYFEFDKGVGNLWGRNEFTLSFWFKLDELRDGVLLSELYDPDDYRTGTLIEVVDGKLRFMLSARWNYAVTRFELAEKLRKDKWYHFAVSCDGRVQLLAYQSYLNGKEAPTRVIQDSAVDGKRNQVPLYLGYSTLWPSFKGALDELRFYNRVLDANEIAALAEPWSVFRVAKVAPEKRNARQRDVLRFYFEEHAADAALANAQKRLLNARRERKDFLKSVPTTMVMVEDRGKLSHERVAGQFDQLGAEVQASTPKVLPPFPNDLPRDRLGFARWLMDGGNPLAARVTVNRIWQQLFGRGFVDSPENFGMQTAEPMHSELLDWLATEFVRSGWDMKGLIRLIVTSSTYRQSSATHPETWEADPMNRLFARGPRYRLSAPVIRDQALALAGILGTGFGGASVYPYQPKGLWRLTSNRPYKPSTGKDLYRRSLYTFWRRAIAPPSMFLFDSPDREFCNVGTKRTNTPLQALVALNEEGMFEAARLFGERIVREGGRSDEARIRFGYRCVTGRRPSAKEMQILLMGLRSYRMELLGSLENVDRLLSTGESAADPELNPVELATFTSLANVLMNLDKTLTKE